MFQHHLIKHQAASNGKSSCCHRHYVMRTRPGKQIQFGIGIQKRKTKKATYTGNVLNMQQQITL